MPRRSILSSTERQSLVGVPEDRDELIRLYTLSDTDLALIRQHRGAHNRLGFAVLLCYMRYPGTLLAAIDSPPSAKLLRLVAAQLKSSSEAWQVSIFVLMYIIVTYV